LKLEFRAALAEAVRFHNPIAVEIFRRVFLLVAMGTLDPVAVGWVAVG